MEICIPQDETLLQLNRQIEQAISAYIPGNAADYTIRFDLPEQGKVTQSTISVFLYDIQEDLQLRMGENRAYDASQRSWAPGYVPVRCCYLITYWGPTSAGESPALTGTHCDAMCYMNYVLNALVNHRTLPQEENAPILPAYCRILPPAEQLNSLGAFWQALNTTPRLSLSYMVTVPIQLSPSFRDEAKMVTEVEIKGGVQPKPAGAWYQPAACQQATRQLWRALRGATGATEVDLHNVRLVCNFYKQDTLDPSASTQPIKVTVSGVVADNEIKANINQAIQAWVNTTLTVQGNVPLRVKEVDCTQLT